MRIVFLIVFTLITTTGFSQSKWEDIMANAKSASSEYLDSYINKNWKQYVALTHRNIIKMAGGEEMIIKVAEETMSMYQSIGYTLVDPSINGEIQSADSEAGLQILVPATVKMKGSGSELVETPMKLFGLSIDAGKTWKFVDLSHYDAQSIKTFVPEIDDKILEYWSSN